jgi:hypothetical protein
MKSSSRQQLKPSTLINELLGLKFSHISFEEVHSNFIQNKQQEQPLQFSYQSTIGAELKSKQPTISISKSVALNRPTKNSISSPSTASMPTIESKREIPNLSSQSSLSSLSSLNRQYSKDGDLRSALFDKVGTQSTSISKMIGLYNDLSKDNVVVPPSSNLKLEKVNDDIKTAKRSKVDNDATKTKRKPSSSKSSKSSPSKLSEINHLTSTEVSNLLTTKSVNKTILKTYFKEALHTLFGIKRGCIRIDNTDKAISKCSVDELGQYLYQMIRNNEQQ